jgi:hypothetical protein
MNHRQETLCIDRQHQVIGRADDLQTRFLLVVIQLGLAIVFVPGAVLILILVGLYMIGEWIVFQVSGIAHCLRHHRTGDPVHRVRGHFCPPTTVR